MFRLWTGCWVRARSPLIWQESVTIRRGYTVGSAKNFKYWQVSCIYIYISGIYCITIIALIFFPVWLCITYWIKINDVCLWFIFHISASMSLPHMTNEDVQIAGYCIPKHTIVMGFLTTSHLDPKYFPEPRQFRPERFIDDVTGTIAQHDQFIPFSLGNWK